jgi:ribonuclease HII
MSRVEELSVEEIRKRYLDKDVPVSAQILTRLQKDKREGVRKLHAVLKKRFEKQRDERMRMDAMRYFEKLLWKSGIKDIAGVDEAGMAPLAGPVVAASVMFPPDTEIAGINDSKQLDAQTREELATRSAPRLPAWRSASSRWRKSTPSTSITRPPGDAPRVEGLPRAPQHVLVTRAPFPRSPCRRTPSTRATASTSRLPPRRSSPRPRATR